MPVRDGTGPGAQGPMVGREMGQCVLKIDPPHPGKVGGFAGMEGRPVIVSVGSKERKVCHAKRRWNRTDGRGSRNGTRHGNGSGTGPGARPDGWIRPWRRGQLRLSELWKEGPSPTRYAM